MRSAFGTRSFDLDVDTVSREIVFLGLSASPGGYRVCGAQSVTQTAKYEQLTEEAYFAFERKTTITAEQLVEQSDGGRQSGREAKPVDLHPIRDPAQHRVGPGEQLWIVNDDLQETPFRPVRSTKPDVLPLRVERHIGGHCGNSQPDFRSIGIDEQGDGRLALDRMLHGHVRAETPVKALSGQMSAVNCRSFSHDCSLLAAAVKISCHSSMLSLSRTPRNSPLNTSSIRRYNKAFNSGASLTL